MQKSIRSAMSLNFNTTVLLLLAITTGCAPQPSPTQTAYPAEFTSTPIISTPESPTAAASQRLATDAPSQARDWPQFTLAAEFPHSPTQMTLYTQVIPAGLPDEKRLTELMEQLQITGTVSTNTTEAGESELSVTGDSGSFRLVSDDPLLLVIENAPPSQGSDSPPVVQPAEVRSQAAEEFLSARGLLDFPHLIEPLHMSRDQNSAIRVVPLIDGYPLYDYDPLNGRLMVWFNPSGEISVVFWRPLKLIGGDRVDIVSAAVAWDQFVNGDVPEGGTLGQCWQATVFDPNEPYGIAAPLNSPACVTSSSGSSLSYPAATIQEIDLVYFAHDLSLGMSPFAFPADSPARIVYPMWQFSGTTDQGRELLVLWPAIAMQAP